MGLSNKDIKDMSNTNIKVKLKEIEFEYQTIKNDILILCDKLEELQKIYEIGSEELKNRGL
jgi:hypothetical protein